MRRWLPSNTILFALLFLLCTGGLIGGLIFLRERNQAKAVALAPQTPPGDLMRAIAQRDDDGDGLPNWEEALWKSDPAKKDTDGDGVSDFDEARAMQDPTVPGPGNLSAVSGSLASSTAENITASYG